jgi:putative oxidoreductase
MSKTLLHTTDAIGPAILRWTLAVVLFPHGAQKLLGWFGGHGFQGTMGYLTDGIGLPWVIALLVIVIEFFGPLGLALGLLSRPAAFGIASVMVGAVATTHWPHGFFMNWAGNQAGEGFEYHLLAIGMALALMIRGGGAGSIDLLLSRKRR